MPPKFQVGERVRINDALFPTAGQMLLNGVPGTGTIIQVQAASILPYHVRLDKLEHHPYWFYENQLHFEDGAKEKAWSVANAPKPRTPGKAAPVHAEDAH